MGHPCNRTKVKSAGYSLKKVDILSGYTHKKRDTVSDTPLTKT